jgi:tRNA modification GTPase
MFSPEDTIVAIATPPGRGGIGVVRLSGPGCRDIAAAILTRRFPLASRVATFTRLRAGSGGASARQARLHATGSGDASRSVERDQSVGDHVVATSFPAPHSYTGQDVLEISAHGSPVVLRSIVAAAIKAGARLARPGEFTLRAFLNGRLDLVQAEGVSDLIEAATPLQARVAFDQLEGTLTTQIASIDAALFDLVARLEASLDFPDEGYHFVEPAEIETGIASVITRVDQLLASGRQGRVIREGATVVIAGRPNVGKSSIFNMLAGFERAIVADVAGTTRDLITEQVDFEGLAVTLVDTAGARDVLDIVEREGVMRGARAREVADLIVLIVDGAEPLTSEDEKLLRQTAGRHCILVANKSDRPQAHTIPGAIQISAATGEGIDALRKEIFSNLTGGESLRDTAMVTNQRHLALLHEARQSLTRARAAAAESPEEFVLADLQDARARFDEIVGKRTADDVLQHIFERFCIGK